MTSYYRYFKVTKGPLLKALAEVLEARRAAYGVISEFVKDIGASQMYGAGPASYKFDFNVAPDMQVWAKTTPNRGTYYFRARKNTPEGKAMAARIAALPEFPTTNSVFSKVMPDLHPDFPVIIDGNRWMAPHVRMYSMRNPKLMVIQVPWRDEDEKALKAYAKQAKSKNRTEYSTVMDYLTTWTPPAWAVEIKEWEAMKLIDEVSP